MDEDVVEADVYHNTMPGVDISAHFPAAAHDVLGIQGQPILAAPTLRFGPLLGNQLPSLADAKEILLDFPDDFQRPQGAVESPSCLSEEVDLNRALVCVDGLQKPRGFCLGELIVEVCINDHFNFIKNFLDAHHSSRAEGLVFLRLFHLVVLPYLIQSAFSQLDPLQQPFE